MYIHTSIVYTSCMVYIYNIYIYIYVVCGILDIPYRSWTLQILYGLWTPLQSL